MIINKSYDASCVSWGSTKLNRRLIGMGIDLRQPRLGNRV
jgi:hypothetical protein